MASSRRFATSFKLIHLAIFLHTTLGLASQVTSEAQHAELRNRDEGIRQQQDVHVVYGSVPSPVLASIQRPVIPTFTVGPNVESFDKESSTNGNSVDENAELSTKLLSNLVDRIRHSATTSKVFETQTVTGFLDFVTTVGNTVLIFTPQIMTQAKSQDFGAGLASQSPVLGLDEDQAPSIGIEQLFRDFERPDETLIESSFGFNPSTSLIQPSSVVKTAELKEGDAPKQSIVVVPQPKETVLIVEPTSINSEPQASSVRVQSSTILSNFVDGANSVGLVTSTGNTLIANGVTTVNAIRVFGTYLAGGQYAQVVQSSAEIFKDKIQPTASGFSGTVQYVSEKPSFGVEVAGVNEQKPKKRENANLGAIFEGAEDEDEDAGKPVTTTGSRLTLGSQQKEAATNDLRNRLKNRFQKFKANIKEEDQARSGVVGHGSVSQIDPALLRNGKTSGFTRERSKSRALEANLPEPLATDEESNADDAVEADRNGSQRAFTFGGNSSNRRNFREQPPKPKPAAPQRASTPSRRRQTNTPTRNSADLSGQASIQHETISTEFGGKKRGSGSNSFRNSALNRFRTPKPTTTIVTPEETDVEEQQQQPQRLPSVSAFKNAAANRPHHEDSAGSKPAVAKPVIFKSFDRFSRPDIRKSLLEKILTKGKGENTLDPEEAKKKKEEAAAAAAVNNHDEVEDVEEEDEVESNDVDAHLQTTLRVSTLFPTDSVSSVYLAVATIRSPYSFDFEEGKSTRFITVTRTFTSKIAEASSTAGPSLDSIQPTQATKTPLFHTETIPPPENILTSSVPNPFESEDVDLISSSIETLAPFVLASTSEVGTPPLKTITETFSTRELTLKTSILPLVVNGRTSHHTLTQSFYVTKLIEAVKTIPAAEFVATEAFKDFSNVLEEAGSEKRESLLPGELEFSDQDNFGLNGPNEVRVPPPEGFADDLKILGSKLEKPAEEPVSIQSSLEPAAETTSAPIAAPVTTPTLPNGFNPLASFTPEQIQQLAFLQYLQNFGGFNAFGGAGLPNAFNAEPITTSSPVLRTETVFATSTIPLFLGAKKFFTTLTQSIGMTTITDYEMMTVNAPQHAAAPDFAAMFGGQQPGLATAALPAAAAFIESTSEVIKDTVIPSTIYKEIKITFRNTPTTTTLTSTTMVSTQITSYVTKTVRAQPTLNPFNPFAAFG